MKRASLFVMLASLATVWSGSSAIAGDHASAPPSAHGSGLPSPYLNETSGGYASQMPGSLVGAECGCGNSACSGVVCGRSHGFYGEAEALFFKYSRADGTRVGSSLDESIDSDYEFAPRLSFGYVGCTGLGARIRWFDYDQDSTPTEGGLSSLDVDTYTVDIELFDRFRLNRNWDLELSGGVRYNEFDEAMYDEDLPEVETRLNSFTGWGGIVGLTAIRNVGRFGGVYGRLRQAILVDDKYIRNENGNDQAVLLEDSIVGATELATGWEFNHRTRSGSLWTLRAGYEWQLWHNYSSSFAGPVAGTAAFPAAAEEVYTGPADVGFDGFTLSAAYRY